MECALCKYTGKKEYVTVKITKKEGFMESEAYHNLIICPSCGLVRVNKKKSKGKYPMFKLEGVFSNENEKV